jgi:acyl-coenzyme A synthetase/AMP-(fatty) acid ligase
MEALLNHLQKHAGTIAFIENERHVTYSTFINDILSAEKEIKTQINSEQIIFQWNYATNYKNIVLLFAFAKCKGIIVPDNLTGKLLSNHESKTIRCFDSEIKAYENIRNEFTDELKKRNTPGIIISTSGTGNTAKDIVHDFGLLCEKYLKLKTKFISVLTFSLEHISGIETMLSLISPGSTIILEEDRTPFALANAIKKNEVTLIACTPSFLVQLLLKNILNEEYFHSVKIINCGGEALTSQWYERFHEKIPGVEIRQAFGTTESTNFRTHTHPDNIKRFKPGELNKDYTIRNNTLLLKNRNYMLGNWNENKINREEWIETTDIVEVDDDGYIEIINRSEKIISVGGRKVNPVEIENTIQLLPFIKYVKVYGEKNILMGQIVIADVICDSNEEEDIKKNIKNHCSKLLDDYKVPVKIKVLKELPITLRFKNYIS